MFHTRLCLWRKLAILKPVMLNNRPPNVLGKNTVSLSFFKHSSHCCCVDFKIVFIDLKIKNLKITSHDNVPFSRVVLCRNRSEFLRNLGKRDSLSGAKNKNTLFLVNLGGRSPTILLIQLGKSEITIYKILTTSQSSAQSKSLYPH